MLGMQETLMRVRSVPKLAFLSVTDIHTYRRKTRCEAGLAASRQGARQLFTNRSFLVGFLQGLLLLSMGSTFRGLTRTV